MKRIPTPPSEQNLSRGLRVIRYVRREFWQWTWIIAGVLAARASLAHHPHPDQKLFFETHPSEKVQTIIHP